jgi:hypothetical protein
MQANNSGSRVNNLIDDSEMLNISDFQRPNNDLFNLCGRLYDSSKIKIASILFCMFIILNTDIYAENILCRFFKNSYDTDYETITEKGIVISAMVLAIFYIVLDILYEKKII